MASSPAASRSAGDKVGLALYGAWSAWFATAMLHRDRQVRSPVYRARTVHELGSGSRLERTFSVIEWPLKAFRDAEQGWGKYLVDADLSGLRLNDRHGLNKSNLRGAVLRGAVCEGLMLHQVEWGGAILDGSEWTDCFFYKSNFSPASAQGAAFSDCTFSWWVGGSLNGACFQNCRLAALQPSSAEAARFVDCSCGKVSLASADLAGVVFERCDLRKADFEGADLRGATFVGCDLRYANLADARLDGATFRDCEIYGIGLWGARGELAEAVGLTVRRSDDAAGIELDGLRVAPFVASLLDGNGIRELVDGLASTLVLVLGRFAPPHKTVLDRLRQELRAAGYTAIVFDSAAPTSRDTTETVAVLARLSRFVIADLTDPQSAPYELQEFAKDCATPLQPVTRAEPPFSMSGDLEKYPWVLPARTFANGDDLIAALPELVERLERCRAVLDQEREERAGHGRSITRPR